MNSSEIKSLAKVKLIGNHVLVVLLMFLNSALAGILTTVSDRFAPYNIDYTFTQIPNPNSSPSLYVLFSFGASILAILLGFALLKIVIDIVRDQKPNLTDCYASAFSDDPIKTVVISFLVALFTFLWMLLFIIPGIIKAYAYGMYLYLLDVKPQMTITETIKESMRLMDGKKMDLFLLDLSYIPAYILGIFTLGIYWFWVAPRHMVARVIFFEQVFEAAYPVKPVIEADIETNE